VAPAAGREPPDRALPHGGQSVRPPLPGAAAAPPDDGPGRPRRGALRRRRAVRPPGRLHQSLCGRQRRPDASRGRPPGPQRHPDLRTVRDLQGGAGRRLAGAHDHVREPQGAEAEAGVPAGEAEALLLRQPRHPRLQLESHTCFNIFVVVVSQFHALEFCYVSIFYLNNMDCFFPV